MPDRIITWGILSLISVGFSLHPAHSQTITPDGSGTIIQYQGQTYRITGGTQAGANLFHSFQQFGLNSGEIAQFLSQPGIEHILGRVTGGDPSVINGLLQVTGSNAHLYLMNPAGIIFGAGSSLDIPGSFTATTADRIGFEGGWFNAFGPNDYSQLIGNPNQFSFLSEQPGGIINGGHLFTPGNLSLLGGTVINTGNIQGNHVTLAAVPGTSLVRLAQPGMLLTVEVEQSQLEAGITALDLPTLLTGSGISLPQDVQPGEVLITNQVQGQTVDLMATARVLPLAPELIRTGDGSDHAPTVVLFPENLGEPWAINVIDLRADQPYDLLYGGKAGTVSSLILPDQEGITRINSILERVTEPIDKLNLVTEGNQGNVWLGQTWLNAENIGNYQSQIAQWGEQLGPNAALLIYSCFTALGAIGESFVNTLADLTGVTVAASTNATGSANYGGDWDLEYQTGNLEIVNPFTVETLNDWDGKLATLTVTNANDNGPDSLRGQIGAAAAGDTVIFDMARTVTLTTGSINWAKNNLTIDGNGSTVSGNNASGVFNITLPGSTTTFQNITITEGSSSISGGGIRNLGNATVINSTISNNYSTDSGGGIRNNGMLTVINSTISGNSAQYDGGGIDTGSVTLINSTISGNSSTNASGGGIYSNSGGTITNSTVANNWASEKGGGIRSFGAVTLTNSTISNNSAGIEGGGISSAGGVTLANSTIAFNNATSIGGGLALANNNTHTFTNSIIANNTAPTGPDISVINGTHTFNISHSLILSTAGMTGSGIPTNGVNGNIVGLDPLLGPLANNGGPTQTHALLPGSPALNSGDNASTIVTVDQRGNPRIVYGRVDMGAYEAEEPLTPLPDLPPSSENPKGDLSQSCPPYCEEENLEDEVDTDTWVEQDIQDTLDLGVEDLEASFNQEYADYLGLDEIPTISLPEAQSILNRIAQATGKKPALLYLTFVPKGIESTPELTQSLIASAQLDKLPELAQRNRNLAGATDELQLVLVTPGQQTAIKRLTVNRAQAVAMASRLNRAIIRPQGDSYLDPAQQLYQWLIAPLQADLQSHEIDHISIIADAGLRFIPFAALHDGQRFLIEQHSVGLMPSLSLSDHTFQSVQGLPILAMGASTFTNQEPLPAVPLELSLITEEIASGTKLINEDFTLNQLRAARAERSYRMVHLGTHGEFQSGSPENSYIELWGDRLTLDRIGELGLNNPPVELLVLSACRTALGSNEAELGFAGFAVQAGVKSVLGSLWYVSDAGTLGLMSAFYQQLQTAPIKAEALRQTQLAMAQGKVYLDGVNLVSGTQTVPLTPELANLGQVDLSHPYYWSAFTMIGSPW
ncbi:CHAT domain-containing protein [Spirulina sp. CCNP1310]|uniref:CHAT domain-containing protein n=1 Tax=Spirulina sp. CCNP1310 TaxID=3110249 RepID=UPI002B217A82|nr:CHAT domain-containing protein [Spirulina sp. CCNP1310]MEA5417610.1 CHAT domain-containing protein [Spirulina sp. CCNP1310]